MCMWVCGKKFRHQVFMFSYILVYIIEYVLYSLKIFGNVSVCGQGICIFTNV